MLCFQAAYNCDVSVKSEPGEWNEQHSTVEPPGQKSSSVHRNVFCDVKVNSVDTSLPHNSSHLLQPKLEHECIINESAVDKHVCGAEQGGSDDARVLSIVVKLPLIARLRHLKCSTPVLSVKTEATDTTGDASAANNATTDFADAAASTDEQETDAKKEATAAEKGQQLARETIANIFGSEAHPPTMMKIPIKRRVGRDSEERDDAKCSRNNDVVHDHLSHRQRGRYVLDFRLVCEIHMPIFHNFIHVTNNAYFFI